MSDLKFMTDQCISPKTAEFLKGLGLDVVGFRELGLTDITDQVVYRVLRDNDVILITYDVDAVPFFQTEKDIPGLILLRVQPQILEVLHPALEIFFNKFETEELEENIIIINNKNYQLVPYKEKEKQR